MCYVLLIYKFINIVLFVLVIFYCVYKYYDKKWFIEKRVEFFFLVLEENIIIGRERGIEIFG